MKLNKRKIKLILKRLRNLPRGLSFFAYTYNMIRLMLAKKFRWTTLPIPDTVMLEVTNNCQLKCKMCAREHEYGEEMDCGFMDIDKAKKFLDKYAKYFNRIALTGLGEPLLYPKLIELADYIKKSNKGIAIFVSINAQLPNLTPKLHALVPYVDTLQVSLDGVDEVYDKIRVNGDSKVVIENIKTLVGLQKEHDFNLLVNTVVFEDNYKSMADIVELTNELGVQELIFNTINQVAYKKPWHDSSMYHSPEFEEECQKAELKAKELGLQFTFNKHSKDVFFSDCPYLWGHLTVTWDGYLVPCCAKPFPKLMNFGNIFEKPLLECVNHKDLVAFRELSNKNKPPKFCDNCHYTLNNK